jgi:hypothetical protein
MRKKLIVCGCSFSAASELLPGTSYPEILADKLDWDLEQLARPGCSNGGIRLQIDEVIRRRPDFAIIAPTFHDRMEIPAPGYDPAEGIGNINYGNRAYRMICEPILSLAENRTNTNRSRSLNKDTQDAVRQYIKYLHDSNWKLQTDTWIMRDGIVQAYLAGIKFIVLPDNLWTADTIRNLIPSIVPDRYLITDNEKLPQHARWLYPFKDVDPGYHGSPESQQFLADIYYDIITNWRD